MPVNLRNLFLMLLLIFLNYYLFSGCGKKEEKAVVPDPEVQVYSAETREIPVLKEWVGQTFGDNDIEIRARVDGFVEGLFFQEGSTVQKGDLLYMINSDELQQRLVDARGKYTEAQTMLVKAKNDADRYKPLAEAGAVSQQRYESAVAYYESMKGSVESANAGVKLAEINLSYARVTAPISGVIGISKVYEGDYVTRVAGSLLNTVSSIDPIKVRFSISESEYLNIKRLALKEGRTGTKLNKQIDMILSDGTIYPYKGTANIANRQIDPSTGTMTIEATFPNPEKLLRPGLFCKISTDLSTLQNALVIPLRSVMDMQGIFNVYVVDNDNKVRLKSIKKGIQYEQFTVIESGLSKGDRVIVEGLLKVKPEMTVSPKEINVQFDSNFVKPGSAE